MKREIRKMIEPIDIARKRLRLATGTATDEEKSRFLLGLNIYQIAKFWPNPEFDSWAEIALDLLDRQGGIDSQQIESRIIVGIVWAKVAGFDLDVNSKTIAEFLLRKRQ